MKYLELNLGRVIDRSQVLCDSCVFGHIQRGFAMGQEVIQCSFGYGMRWLPFYVLECSDHQPRFKTRPGISFRTEALVHIDKDDS